MLSFAWISGLVLFSLYFRNIWKYYKLNKRPIEGDPAGELPELTVIVPFRNEAPNLSERIQSLLQQDYPESKFRVLLVNDHSTDDFRKYLLDLPSHFSVLDLPDHLQGKVSALDYAIKQTNTEWIVCTDADCTAGKNWLRSFFENELADDTIALCGPVRIQSDGSLIQELQFLDMIGVMGMTAAGHRGLDFALANGANFAFRKSAFLEVGGFKGSEQWLAADDMWLISKFSSLKEKRILFIDQLKAEVITFPELSWGSFLKQRIRWAGKTSSYTNPNMLYHIGVAYAFSVYLLAVTILCLMNVSFLAVLVVFFIGRFSVDFLYLHFMTKKYGHQLDRRSYLMVQCLHIFYIVTAGLLALGKKRYKWKDRILN